MTDEIIGFRVTIESPDGQMSDDDSWEMWSGGGAGIEVCHAAGPGASPAPAPGHESVGEITLRGAMTDGRKALLDWINDAVAGKGWTRNMHITELLNVDGTVRPGKTYSYFDGLPVGYVFPRLAVTHTTGNVMEEVRLKFQRCELK